MNKSEMEQQLIDAAIRIAVRALKKGRSYTDILSELPIDKCHEAVVHECNRFGYRYSEKMLREWRDLYQHVAYSVVRRVCVQEMCQLVPYENGAE